MGQYEHLAEVMSSKPVGLFFLPWKLKWKFCADIRNYFIRISSQKSLKSKSDFQVLMAIDWSGVHELVILLFCCGSASFWFNWGCVSLAEEFELETRAVGQLVDCLVFKGPVGLFCNCPFVGKMWKWRSQADRRWPTRIGPRWKPGQESAAAWVHWSLFTHEQTT